MSRRQFAESGPWAGWKEGRELAAQCMLIVRCYSLIPGPSPLPGRPRRPSSPGLQPLNSSHFTDSLSGTRLFSLARNRWLERHPGKPGRRRPQRPSSAGDPCPSKTRTPRETPKCLAEICTGGSGWPSPPTYLPRRVSERRGGRRLGLSSRRAARLSVHRAAVTRRAIRGTFPPPARRLPPVALAAGRSTQPTHPEKARLDCGRGAGPPPLPRSRGAWPAPVTAPPALDAVTGAAGPLRTGWGPDTPVSGLVKPELLACVSTAECAL